MKLICPDCGAQYESGKFCQECGAKLQEVAPELVCPSCGHKAKSGRFCPECGTKLAEQIVTPKATEKEEPVKPTFNEKDSRLAKYYDKKGFPRTIPQEERDVAIEELTQYADQNIAEAKMLLGGILMSDSKNKDAIIKGVKLIKEAEEAGDKLAYYQMGIAYFWGYDTLVEQNHEEAEKRLLEAFQEYQDGGTAGFLAILYTFSTVKCDFKKAFDYATIAVEDDDSDGYFVLGTLYHNGLGVEKNVNLALENYKMAAAFGDETAMNQIGLFFMGNDDFDANPEQSFYWFNEAAKKGSDEGMYNLGCCYQNGFGTETDVEQAAEWFKKSAELGYVNAMCELGEYYQEILFDFNKAKMWYLKAAELGNAEAQYELAKCFDREKNYKEAIKWYKKAMEQNNPLAYLNLGEYYCDGVGVEKDIKKAKELFIKAAELGNAEAQNRLGVFYADIENNYKEAVKWYKKAIEQDYPMAYRNLGFCYLDGGGVKKDLKKADELLSKASELGVVYARDIEDAEIDKANSLMDEGKQKEAIKIYKELAEKGNARAQGNYGNCLLQASGTKQNLKEGIVWLEKSASQDNEWAYLRLAEAYLGWDYKGKSLPYNTEKAKDYLSKAISLGADTDEINQLAMLTMPSVDFSNIKVNRDVKEQGKLGFEVVLKMVANAMVGRKLNFSAYCILKNGEKGCLSKPGKSKGNPISCYYVEIHKPQKLSTIWDQFKFFIPYSEIINIKAKWEGTLVLMAWDQTNKKPELLTCEEISFSISCTTHMFRSNEWLMLLKQGSAKRLVTVPQKRIPLVAPSPKTKDVKNKVSKLPMDKIKKAANDSYPKESLKSLAIAALKIAEVIQERLPNAEVSYMVHPSEFDPSVSPDALPVHFLFKKNGNPVVAVVAVTLYGYKTPRVLETAIACENNGIGYVRVFANGSYADWITGWSEFTKGPVSQESVEFCKNWLVGEITRYL